MKRLSFFSFMIAIMSCMALGVKGQSRKTYNFKYAPDKAGSASAFSIQLIADTDQNPSKDGIKFSVIITNASGKEKTILNPFQTTNFSLLNSKFQVVSIPEIPASLINSVQKKPTGYKSFNPSQVKINGKISEQDVFADTFTIPAGATCELQYAISKIIAPSANKPYTPSDEVRIVPDRYTLTVFSGLIEVNPQTAAKDKKNGNAFETQPILINYGSK